MVVRIGVEEEFHVVDVESGALTPRADAVLGRLSRHSSAYTQEFPQSVVESNSGVHARLDELHADLTASRRRLNAAASAQGLAVMAAGAAPIARLGVVPATDDPRYHAMRDEYRRVADEQLICGAQVHVDVPDRDTAVRALCAINPWLPPLLALSASSPYWLGADTGYASWRTMIWQRWPTSGPAGCFTSAEEYDAAVEELIVSGVISDPGMIYYDIRPSAHLQTLELRICDACPRVETVVLIAGLFRALVVDACAQAEADRDAGAGCDGRHEWLRTATWRAARSGLEGDLIDPATHEPAPAPDVVRRVLRRLRPTLEAHGDWDLVNGLAEEALARGSAAHRLRRAASEDDLLSAVDLLLAETRGENRGRAPLGRRRGAVPSRAEGMPAKAYWR
ncbi:glutamate--cysteine ligase [Streptomyces sp. TX20-6-3]|uniref:carboxylate-amine ligase n=1 Tax=Streptomyces sp. TX20-6-3 TaxID=3028705 RepID=UPI0029BB2307|nr:glutamate--cysteine ligase [Streptomyces sp. TX20-6-3]MDX2564510.1 glutamate--cysteine ligase [Streptomyces sp. TX20-6-3]